MVHSEWEKRYFFVVDFCDDLLVGERAMRATRELAANAAKVSLGDTKGVRQLRLTWQVRRHRGYSDVDG
jgi:enoyl reductase-like protein